MAVLNTLRRGQQGPMVEFLQKALIRAGYNPGEIDGQFGTKTESAVRNFQRNKGLTPDGIVGQNTWAALTPYLTGYVRHRIKSGDTLYGLAQRYRTTIRPIEAANPGINPLNLQIGQILIIPLGFDVVPTDIQFTSTVLEYCINGLTTRYPFLQRGSAGQSVMGRDIWYLQMGIGERQVFYNATHHANEWITSALLMKFIEEYAKKYSNGGKVFDIDAEYLYNNSRMMVIPMVNPDGVDLVTGALISGPYYNQAVQYAQDYPEIDFPSGWKANISGIDPNLQYPAGWEQAREIKFAQGYTSPAPRDYVGSAPLEAPESRAVYNFTKSQDFALTLSYHTQGQVIYWKYGDYLPENSYEIGRKFSDVSGYTLDITPPESAYAGYKDWFIQEYNRPGYTIEAGIGASPVPLTQFDEIYNANIGILTLGMSLAIQNL
jgi:g-D-glutamyl-meso-diaminopimelate peptidase